MKKILNLTAILATLVLAFACKKTEVIELTVSPLSVSFEAAGGDQSVAISCNDAWTVSKNADWLSVSADKGNGNAALKITATENKGLETREADVTVAAGEIKRVVRVTQLGKKPVLTVSPDALNATDEGGELELTVTSNVEWTLTIPKDAAWVSADKKSGEGNGTVKFTVAANESLEARETELVFASGNMVPVKVKLTQMGQEPFFAIDMEKVEATYGGGTYAIAVTTNLPWNLAIPEEATWITVDVAEGEKDATVTLSVDENITLATREAIVIFTAGEGIEVQLPVSQQAGVPSHASDSLALVALYNAWGGAANMKEDRAWDITKAMDDAEAKWYGVTLTDGRVTALKLLKGTITADWTIPAEIGTLTELTDLRFIDCKVNGAIPDAIYSLEKLESLYLTNNKVTGTLSSSIANLKNLTNVYIDQNADLGGALPAEIGQLSKLVNLNIAKTSFSGTIPSTVANLDALKNFMAYSTKFSGEAPDWWDQMDALELVQLYDIPTLTGALPASFGKCAKLKNIYMYECNFEGNIPESWANLPSTMVNVRVYGNKLKGVVPAAVQAHPKWSNWKPEQYILPQQDGYGLTVGYSRESDSLALVALYNAWGGAANMKDDRAWDLTKAMDDAEAKWYGVTMAEGRVTALKLLKGTITADWTIPAEIGTLTELTDLRFIDCKVNGEIPDAIYSLENLQSFYLTNNKVSGGLSSKVANLKNLTNLYIDQNADLGGSLPEEIGQLSKLVNLNIAKTSFSGTIPSTVANLDALKNFMAYSTKFSGEAPDWWDQMDALELVQLYDIPTLSGPLPASFGNCAKLKNIYMYECNFEGNIPESWANLPSTMVNVRVYGNKLQGVVPAAVQEHPKWSAWKPEQYILPQQDGYGLTIE